ncbi:MAG: DUF2085 domain-containing protein, partial [Anaerolineaceae bacterium]|nr:DUF2085 domain-containing protein [Anaerolineaceae bacterium]
AFFRRAGIRRDRMLLGICRRWLELATLFLALYVALPVLAPVFMKLGLETPGRAIYTLYSPFCHQFAFRSWFIGGQQTNWPREQAGLDNVSFERGALESPAFRELFARYAGMDSADITLDDLSAFTPALQFASRAFPGDEKFGFKLSLCERDITIYGAMLAGALLYRRWRSNLRPAPIWLYLLLGLAPVGIDGFSQLLGYPPFSLWPPRETTPAFRVVTGALFGLLNVWLGFPWLEISFQELREPLERRLAGRRRLAGT